MQYNFIPCWSTTSWIFWEWRTTVVQDELKDLVQRSNQSWIAHKVFNFKRRIFVESVMSEIQHLLVIICTSVTSPLLLFPLCLWTWLLLWIPWRQAEVKQQRCGKMVAWGKRARRGLSLAPAFSPLKVPNFGSCSCSPAQWQNKGFTVWPAAQDVGTEFALVLLEKRSSHIESTGLGESPNW